MSDNYLRLIPISPEYIPETLASEEAQRQLSAFVPHADEVKVIITDEIEFVDQGGNFERVVCPLCERELDIGWWQEAMDAAYATRFASLVVDLPCCHNESSLNSLRYEWPAGFARFVLEARNPGTDLNEAQVHALEQILGCALRKIWVHY
ncbi:MAG: hypothetical protein IPK19_13765 [Chloroflexi bacterium]|nr:hypothetical protein [Chloroflexota bacterium]